MGLFDFFKEKKNDNPYKNLPPSFQEAFAVLFPNGVNDHERQLKELAAHYGSKYDKQAIDSNLIFILSGYLITGNTKTHEVAISNVLARPNNRMTKTEVEYLYDYALKNHPKLKGLVVAKEIMDTLSSDGCSTDTIPGGVGLFGYSACNPIPAEGVIGIYDYLSRLYDGSGCLVSYERVGTVEREISVHPIDEFMISSAAGISKLYFSAYQKRTSQLSPSGYVLVDANKVILSNGGTTLSIGHKLDKELLDLPELMGLRSFACFSDKELTGKNEGIKEAERTNRRAIVLSNDGNYNGALERLDRAISLGSLNAVNNKFAVLHTAGRYKEGYDFLISTLDTEMETIGGLYNLAVLYYNGENDTNYNIKKDIKLSYNLLITAKTTAINEMEEFVESTVKKAKELMARLESEDPSLLEIKDKRTSSPQKPIVSDTAIDLDDTPSKSSTEFKLQSSTPTSDIYGTKLINRVSDIYHCIHYASEHMAEQMVGLPKLSEKGILELDVLFAGILSHHIDSEIVFLSLIAGSKEFSYIPIRDLKTAMTSYRNQYEYCILCENVLKRVPLLEFAKSNGGKLKIMTSAQEDKFGNTKMPIFEQSNSQILKCAFGFWGDNTQTAEFIIANKNEIVIEIRKDGEYVFRLAREIKEDYNFFLKYIAFYTYTSPLNFHNAILGTKIEDAVKEIKRGKSNVIVMSDVHSVKPSDFEESSDIIPTIQYAFSEGVRFVETLAASNGLVGKFSE